MERYTETPRHVALADLSKARGRSPDHPLDPSLISKWCADLGFKPGLSYFNDDQMQQLRAINMHYASGGNRRELLQIMKANPEWYALKN